MDDPNIRVKREKSDAMEHNAPATSPPSHHREAAEMIRHLDLAADIRDALPHLDPVYLNPTLSVILAAGPAEPADLQFLREEDFREYLSPLQRRRLVFYFTNKYRGGFVPSSENGTSSSYNMDRGAPFHREGAAGDESKPENAASPSAPHIPARGTKGLHHPGKSKFGKAPAGTVEGRINLMSNRISNLQKTMEHVRSVCEYTNLIVSEMGGGAPRPEPLTEEQLQPSPSCNFSFAPANTLEELDEILNNDEIVPYLKTCERDTLTGTLRTMLKNLLTRELAVQFSFTGLGAKRQRTKYSFKNHKLYRIFQQAVRATRHRTANLSEMDVVLKNVLKSAMDWDGHRGRRNQDAQQPLDPSRLCELSVGGQEAAPGQDYSNYAAQPWAAGSLASGLSSLSGSARWNMPE